MKKSIVIYCLILLVFGAGIFLILRQGATLPATPATASGETTSSLSSLKTNLEDPLSRLFLQITVIMLVARIFGTVFSRLGQPAVIGEMVAGILLGPSLFGWLAPDAFHYIFAPASLSTLKLLSEIGVCIFMFTVGMDLDIEHLRQRAHTAIVVGHAGILVPYFLGVAAALYLFQNYAMPGAAFLPFALFMGISMSITAFPVLARILEERGLSKTPLGATALTSAAIGDVTAWSILAVVVAIARASGLNGCAWTVGLTLVFVGFMLLVVRPGLPRWIGNSALTADPPGKSLLAAMLALLLVSALATEVIGIHALFGSFLAGIVLPPQGDFRHRLKLRIENFSSVFLLPLFFVFTGLRTQINSLNGMESWLICAGIILIATVGKLGSSLVTARLTGMGWKDSFALGALMNTRGLMELIALNIGYDLGILLARIFAMLVIMALATTFLTAPLLALAGTGRASPPR